MLYWIGYYFWTALGILFYPRTLHGVENVPRKGPCIIASNHQSNMDPMLLGISFNRPISYFAKEELFKNKFFAWVLYQVGAFPVKRGKGDVGAIKETLKRLKKGSPVVIFPGGTRQLKHDTDQVQEGIALLAVKSGVPVLPTHIKGSDKLLPKGASFLSRQQITITFGEPKVYTKKESYAQIAREIMKDIHNLRPQSPRK